MENELSVNSMYIILFSRFEQGYCYFGNKCTFAHGDEECTYWKASYQLQAQQLAQFQEKRLLTENFSENVWRRMKHEGEHHVVSNIFGGYISYTMFGHSYITIMIRFG